MAACKTNTKALRAVLRTPAPTIPIFFSRRVGRHCDSCMRVTNSPIGGNHSCPIIAQTGNNLRPKSPSQKVEHKGASGQAWSGSWVKGLTLSPFLECPTSQHPKHKDETVLEGSWWQVEGPTVPGQAPCHPWHDCGADTFRTTTLGNSPVTSTGAPQGVSPPH